MRFRRQNKGRIAFPYELLYVAMSAFFADTGITTPAMSCFLDRGKSKGSNVTSMEMTGDEVVRRSQLLNIELGTDARHLTYLRRRPDALLVFHNGTGRLYEEVVRKCNTKFLQARFNHNFETN